MDIRQKQRKWANAWQTAAGSLKKLKKDELRADDYYEKNQKLLDEMLQYACDSGLKRGGSGLVEQQRIFKKAVAPGKIERICREESGGNRPEIHSPEECPEDET